MKIIEKTYNWAYGATARTRTDLVVIHHAAGTGTPDFIHSLHIANGWRGMAYHFYVRKDGAVYRGREEWACGGHTTDYNSNSIGICFEGNFEFDQMGEAQKNSGIELLAYIRGKYSNLTVYRHGQLNATACPGRNFPFDAIVGGSVTTPEIPDQDTPLYRVRKAWNDVESQISAFLDLEKAQSEAQTNPGYSVYDPDGTVVYSPWSDGCPYGTATSTVQNGTSGTAAYRCQWYLNELGYDVGDIDGMCGAVTVAAIKSFQTDKGLVVDGICGDNTWKALENAYNAGLESEKEPEQGATDATEAALAWAVSIGLFIGTGSTETGTPDYAWKDFLTREQAALLFYRFAQFTGVV